MAISNFIQWNPTSANQETDAAYLADSQRSGGATDPSFFASALANKLFYQVSTGMTALMQAIANKGFPVSDVSVSALTATLANILTTADVKPGLQQVAYASSLIFNCAVANGFEVTLTGNVGSIGVTGMTAGQTITLVFVQDAVGAHTVAFPSNVKSPGTVASAANSSSAQTFIVLADSNLHPTGPMVVS